MTDLLDPPVVDANEQLDEALLCTAIEDVTHDVKSFVLSRPGGLPLAFEPGQYLTVTLGLPDGPLQRCYSISSSPAFPDRFTITVKRVPGGPASNWLHDVFAVGDLLPVTGPHGGFTTTRHPAPAYLFLSAGAGITPVMSMTRALADSPEPCDVVFVHSARTPRDIVFRAELDALAAARPDIAVTSVCEDSLDDDPWTGPVGRLSLRTLLRAAPDLHDREVFTCGPEGYMAAVRELLDLAGVDPARCHEESYDLSRPVVEEGPPPTGERHAVELRRTGQSIECRSDQTILDAAQRAGVRLPSMCARGVCGTCRTTLLAGEVDLDDAGGLRPRDIEQGQVLLCSSRPRGDVVVDA